MDKKVGIGILLPLFRIVLLADERELARKPQPFNLSLDFGLVAANIRADYPNCPALWLDASPGGDEVEEALAGVEAGEEKRGFQSVGTRLPDGQRFRNVDTVRNDENRLVQLPRTDIMRLLVGRCVKSGHPHQIPALIEKHGQTLLVRFLTERPRIQHSPRGEHDGNAVPTGQQKRNMILPHPETVQVDDVWFKPGDELVYFAPDCTPAAFPAGAEMRAVQIDPPRHRPLDEQCRVNLCGSQRPAESDDRAGRPPALWLNCGNRMQDSHRHCGRPAPLIGTDSMWEYRFFKRRKGFSIRA